jgi:YVTN family beta-propeller protein
LLAYISMQSLDQVAVVSLTQRAPAGEPIPAGAAPANMAINPRSDREYLYVANHSTNTVSFLNVRTRQLEKPVPSGEKPWDVAVTPTGQFLYVTNIGDRTVAQIDVEARSRIHPFTFDQQTYPNFQPRGIATHPVTSESANKGEAYVVSEGNSGNSSTPEGMVVVLKDRSIGTPIKLTGAGQLWKAAVTPKGDRLLVTDRKSSKLWTIDLATGKPGQAIELGVSGSWDVVVNSNKANPIAFVSLMEKGQVVAVDVNSGTAGTPISVVPQGAGNQLRQPQALALNSQGNELWVALFGSNEVVVFPGITGTNFPVGPRLINYSYTQGQAGAPEDIVLGRGVQ